MKLLNFKPLVQYLRTASIALLAPIVIISALVVNIQPAMAIVNLPFLSSHPFGAMSNKMDAAAKNAEGKLESAYGDLTGDTGHQIKGMAKQVQGSAMNVAEDLKEGARSAGKKVADTVGQK